MQKEFNIKVESRVVEEKILNFTSLVVALLSLPLVASSLLRINYTGLRFIYIFHVFVAIVMWSIFLLRGKVKFELRIVLFIVVLMILILPSVPLFGIHDYWGYIAILYSFLAGLFFGKRWGLITVAYTLVCISITAYLFVFTTAITTDIHSEGNHNLYDFLYHGVLLLSVSLTIVFSTNKYRDYFHLILSDLFVAKDNAEKHEHKYKQLSSLTFEGIMIHDNGIIIDVNQSFARMIGYTPEELIGKNLITSNILPEKYHEVIYENMEKNYASPYEVEGLKRDGSTWPVEIELHIVETAGNSSIRVTAIRDISYRKKLENELRDSERKFRELFENSGDALLIIENGEFVNCNLAALKLFEYNSVDELFKVSPAEISPTIQPDGTESSVKAIAMIKLALAKGRHVFEWIHLKKGGKSFFAEISLTAISVKEGKSTIHVVVRDISERKKNIQKIIDKNNQLIATEEKLRASNEKLLATTEALRSNNEELITARKSAEESELLYRGIVDNLIGGYYRTDVEGRLIIASSSAEAITGFSLKNLLGQPITLFYVNPSERERFLEQIKKTGKVFRFPAEFKTKNRGNIIVEINAKIIYNEKGEYNGVEGIFYDVTEDLALKKKWEEELILAKEKAEEGDQLKTLFLQNMSHEIRTPLNAILGFSSFIDDPELPVEARNTYSEIIQKSGNQLLQIVDEIMEMSMLESKKVSIVEEPVCINTLLTDLYSIFDIKAKGKSLKFNIKSTLSDEESTVLTDKVKLTKVLRNILENAIKYTNSGFVEYGYRRKDEELIFYIKDSGIGISPENQERVFDRFIQESEDLSDIKGGLGLGLSITKENVRLLGGRISLKSEIGKGTQFFITIPYNRNAERDENDS